MSPSTTQKIPIEDVVRPAAEEASSLAATLRKPVLASVGIPVAFAEPLSLLAVTRPSMSGWWSQPGLSVAGTEVAVSAEAEGPGRFAEVGRSLQRWFDDAVIHGRDPIAFAGGSFADEAPDGEWKPLPAAAGWIPEVAAIRDAEGAWLVATTLVLKGEDVAATQHLTTVLSHAAEALGYDATVPADAMDVSRPAMSPDDARWREAVGAALAAIEDGSLRKVVLARRARIKGEAPLPWNAAATFERSFPEHLGYLVTRDATSFVGASPELLIQREDDLIRSIPAAGTVAAGAGGLDEEKIRREQEVVAEAVRDALDPFCDGIEGAPAEVTQAGPVDHLTTTIDGHLARNVHVMDLVDALHPTPAVGGDPRDAALAAIAEHEPFDRGWYAGPVGIVDPDGNGTFAVALRGALLHPEGVDLFAGAGIVRGSDAESERAEIDLKLQAAASVLGGSGG